MAVSYREYETYEETGFNCLPTLQDWKGSTPLLDYQYQKEIMKQYQYISNKNTNK